MDLLVSIIELLGLAVPVGGVILFVAMGWRYTHRRYYREEILKQPNLHRGDAAKLEGDMERFRAASTISIFNVGLSWFFMVDLAVDWPWWTCFIAPAVVFLLARWHGIADCRSDLAEQLRQFEREYELSRLMSFIDPQGESDSRDEDDEDYEEYDL